MTWIQMLNIKFINSSYIHSERRAVVAFLWIFILFIRFWIIWWKHFNKRWTGLLLWFYQKPKANSLRSDLFCVCMHWKWRLLMLSKGWWICRIVCHKVAGQSEPVETECLCLSGANQINDNIRRINLQVDIALCRRRKTSDLNQLIRWTLATDTSTSVNNILTNYAFTMNVIAHTSAALDFDCQYWDLISQLLSVR